MNILHRELTGSILRCAHNVHSTLGPGLRESEYEECLQKELDKLGLAVEKQNPKPLAIKERKPDSANRRDLFVEKTVFIGIKSVDELNLVHMAQLMSYLKITGCRIGLLINFNVRSLKDGIKKIIL